MTQHVMRPEKPELSSKAKAQLKMSLPHTATLSRHYIKNGGGLWLECGTGGAKVSAERVLGGLPASGLGLQ